MHVSVRSGGADRLVVRMREHEVILDQPLEGEGTDVGPTPNELFVASLAACIAFYAELYMRQHGGLDGDFHVECDFEMSTDRPPRVARIDVEVPIPDGLDDAHRAALHRVVDHCSVHNSLRQPPEVVISLREQESV